MQSPRKRLRKALALENFIAVLRKLRLFQRPSNCIQKRIYPPVRLKLLCYLEQFYVLPISRVALANSLYLLYQPNTVAPPVYRILSRVYVKLLQVLNHFCVFDAVD